MRVKLIALGDHRQAWEERLDMLEEMLPSVSFCSYIFGGKEGLTELMEAYFAPPFSTEPPDLILAALDEGEERDRQLAFLSKVREANPQTAPDLVLALFGVTAGLRQLVETAGPVQFMLENQSRFNISDPELLLEHYPEEYPHPRVNGYLRALKVPLPGAAPGTVAWGEVGLMDLPMGTLISLHRVGEVMAMDGPQDPRRWLKNVLKKEQITTPWKAPAALYREPKGLFLYPGIPANRVQGVVVKGVGFSGLLDTRRLGNREAPAQLAGALEVIADRRRQEWQAAETRLRTAENRAELPVWCHGRLPTLERLMVRVLQRWGFARAGMILPGENPSVEEPGLVLELTAVKQRVTLAQGLERLPAVSLAPELRGKLGFLARDRSWHDLPWEVIDRVGWEERVEAARVEEWRKRMAADIRAARKQAAGEHRRQILLGQEESVLERARENLGDFLLRGGRVRLWEGAAPPAISKALVLTHDREEAEIMLADMPHVSKKRWLDLSPFRSPESLQASQRETLNHYLDGGAVFITPGALRRVTHIHDTLSRQLVEARESLDTSRAEHQTQTATEARAKETSQRLALQYAGVVLNDWVAAREPALTARLAALRRRQEQDWFTPALVTSCAIVGNSDDSRQGLTAAAQRLFPGMKPARLRVLPYQFDPPDNPRQRREMLEDYLRVVENELNFQPDWSMILLEDEPATAFPLLERIRAAKPPLSRAPVVLLLTRPWLPEEHAPLPWRRVRVIPRFHTKGPGPDQYIDMIESLFQEPAEDTP
ncbi:MAG: hypothetical protein OEV94_10175 [Deltaproteobacteria bacterium]|nr:hypothetical protein [Deltaproteobacteria bacterium]MDH4122058.1 hypothetical protein [Deltaproteobacteria bacterium]